MKKCACTFWGLGFIKKECKYHETHCHDGLCKKKSLKGKRYCKEHQDYWDNLPPDPEAFGGSDF